MKKTIFPAIALLLLTQPLHAQEAARGQAGYENVPAFGGPESVTEQLKRADESRDAMYDWPFFDGYFDWKKQIKEDYDVSFGLHFYGLYQRASDSLPGRDDDAMGNVFRFLGNWTLWEKENGNLGRIEWRVESRSNWGGFQAPGSLGGATGTGLAGGAGSVAGCGELIGLDDSTNHSVGNILASLRCMRLALGATPDDIFIRFFRLHVTFARYRQYTRLEGDVHVFRADARDIDIQLELVVEFVDVDARHPVSGHTAAVGRVPVGEQAIDIVLQLSNSE